MAAERLDDNSHEKLLGPLKAVDLKRKSFRGATVSKVRTEAMNLLVKCVKRVAVGFRNHRIRILSTPTIPMSIHFDHHPR